MPGRFLFGDGATSRGGVRSSRAGERPFLFRKVEEPSGESMLGLLVVKLDQPNNLIGLASSKEKAAKDAGMVTLKIKRVKCLTGRPANPIQSVPPAGVLGKRKAGDLCVGCVFKHIGTPLRFTQRYMLILALVKKPNQVPNLR